MDCKLQQVASFRWQDLSFEHMINIVYNFIQEIMDQSIQWIRSPKSLAHIAPYLKGRLIRPLHDHSIEFEINTDRGPLRLTLPNNSSFEASRHQDYQDMCEMDILNEPEVLSNLIKRYKRDDIFTSIGPTLIALNPYRHIDRLFGRSVLQSARERTLQGRTGEGPPHVYKLAGKAFESIRSQNGKQAIVISGESGAGKTQSTKYCVQFLTALGPKKLHSIQQKILAANPVLQAFGNSKTVRNENSSRFGKFMNIYFEKGGHIIGATIQSYLLQKSRVVTISPNERSFHAFYALTASGKFQVRSSEHYKMLKQSHCYISTHIDDAQYFIQINKAFVEIGLTESQINQIWSIMGCILELGNIQFDERYHSIDETRCCQLLGAKEIGRIAQILGVETPQLQKLLLFQKRKFLKEYTMLPYGAAGCKANRQALCKAVYQSLFQYILKKVQHGLAPEVPVLKGYQIGILDIFGFENFTQNSFEQFCINFSNERLLRLYNHYIFQNEMSILKQDGLEEQITGLTAPTNQSLITLMNGKLSLFSIINDMTLPQFKDQDIIHGFQKLQSSNLSFDKLKPQIFTLNHSPCSVSYSIVGFKNKNQDKLNEDLLDLVGKLWGERKETGGKTILTKFNKQMDDLMNQLETSEVHFMRCIKPNENKRPDHPDQNCILSQIRYLGVLQTIFIRRNTFPHRKTYCDFRRIYCIAFKSLYKEGKDKQDVEQVFRQIEANRSEYLLGRVRIYMSQPLEQKLNRQLTKWRMIREEKAQIIQRAMKRWYIRRIIIKSLKIFKKRLMLLVKIPSSLKVKMLMKGMQQIKVYAHYVREKMIREQEQAKLDMLRQAKQIRQQERQLHNKHLQKAKASEIAASVNESIISQSFNGLKIPFTGQQQHSINKPHGLSILLNETDLVSDRQIDPRAPYIKPQTPSSDLIGKSLAFNEQFLKRIDSSSSFSSEFQLSNSTVTFQDGIDVPLQLIPSPTLAKLRDILQQKYKIEINCSQQDFFSPMSSHCRFKMSDLPENILNQIIQFPVADFFNRILRRRTTFFGSDKTYSEILVCKKTVLNKSMCVLSREEDEKRSLSLFKSLLKIGQQQNINKVLKHVEKFVQDCQQSSIQLKQEIIVQMIRQSNTSYELTAIRIYQIMTVFLHVFHPHAEVIKAALHLFYWKLNSKKLGQTQREYLSYLFSFMVKKIMKKSIIGYLPIGYQIMALICKRQISIPVYLSAGTWIIVNVESFNSFQEIKQKCLRQFGISERLGADLFGFFEVVNFDNQDLEESPIRETNMVWDMITYWQLTKQKYIEGGITAPSFYLMLKFRFAVKTTQEDQQVVELCYAQLEFQFYMGRIMLDHALIFLLGAIIYKIKYQEKAVSEVVMGLLPLSFLKEYKRQQAIDRINIALSELEDAQLNKQQMKFKFIKICSLCQLAFAVQIPLNEDFKLFLKPRELLLVYNYQQKTQKIEVIPLKRLIKWQIDRQSLKLEVVAKEKDQENRIYQINTDCASIFNEILRALSSLKNTVSEHEMPTFKKK